MSVLAGPASYSPPVGARGLVLVTVGTDHHPFDRLVTWVNAYLDDHPEQRDRFFVQSGSASIEPRCAGSKVLGTDQLHALLRKADVMVCHGGPGSISDAWQRGYRPIVVPRLKKFGEHVDDHQADFCAKFAAAGWIRMPRDSAEFGALLDEAAADLSGFKMDADEMGREERAAEAVQRFGELVEDLVSDPRRRVGIGRRARAR